MFSYNKLFLFFLSFSALLSTAHANLPQSSLVPGGIAVIKLQHHTSSGSRPKVIFNSHQAAVIKHQDSWFTVIGIPLEAAPGNLSFKVIGEKKFTQTFKISHKAYHEEHLTIRDQDKVSPRSAVDQQRVVAEIALIRSLYANFDDRELHDLHFRAPTIGRKSSPFGLKRILNGIPKAAHSGLDIAAPIGTPVLAPKTGIVVKTKNFFFNGNSIFIDHGQGLITNYCHLDSIEVAEGQYVQQGEIIGKVGMTGRVTGPHLHWSISLNNVRIDPQLLLAD
jgi:murein DD-endopeptidase MepM/ murein hydrolase activator NlpD